MMLGIVCLSMVIIFLLYKLCDEYWLYFLAVERCKAYKNRNSLITEEIIKAIDKVQYEKVQ